MGIIVKKMVGKSLQVCSYLLYFKAREDFDGSRVNSYDGLCIKLKTT